MRPGAILLTVAMAVAAVGAVRSPGIARNVPTCMSVVACAVSPRQTNGSPPSSGESTKPTVEKPCSSANRASSQLPS